MKKILIFGSYGFFGNILNFYLKDYNFIICRQGRSKNAQYSCNPLNKYEVHQLINNLKPDIIINLIANTDVDDCEMNISKAFSINCAVLENIVSSSKDSYLIHISTDQIYSGNGPHVEEKANPKNIYSITKYISEFIANKKRSLVLRTNFVGKSYSEKSSFTDWVVKYSEAKKQMYLFKDLFFSPVHTSFLSDVIIKALLDNKVGIYNLGSKNGISKANFIKQLTSHLNIKNPNFKDISVEEYPFKAKRPKDMRLNSKKFEENFSINVPTVQDTIKLVANEYLN